MDAVLNWIWQGIAVAIALALMLRALAGVTAAMRYIVCGLAMVIVLAIPVLWSVSGAPIGPHDAAQVAVAPVVAVPDTPLTSPLTMLLAWLVWVGVQSTVIARSLVGARAIRRGCRPFPADIERRLHQWMRVRFAGRRARLVVSDRVGRAAMLGCGTPLIAVAPQLLERLSDDDLDHVVLHEWAHVQRRDDLANLLQLAIRVVAGWHPAIWWIDRRLRIEREVACDEMAVALGGSPKSYASCLVKLSELPVASPVSLAAHGVLTPGSLRYRVIRIISNRSSMSPARSLSLAMATSATLLLLATGIGAVELFASTWVLPSPVQTLRRSRRLPIPAPQPVATTPRLRLQDSPARTPTPSRTVEVPTVLPGTRDVVPAAEKSPEPAVTLPAQDTGRTITVDTPNAAVGVATTASEAPAPALVGAPAETAPIDARSGWAAAADAGVAIGRGSKAAGVATAGAFTRFARRVAGSF